MINFYKTSRWLHKYLGIAGLLFFIVLSVTGILLMHVDTFALKDTWIDGKYIPEKYYKIKQPKKINVTALYVFPKEAHKILVGTHIGIFKTTDGGVSWTEANQGLYNLEVTVLKGDPSDSQIIYAGTKKGIFKSINGGESWDEWYEETSGLEQTDITDLVIDPTNTERIFAATQNNIFISEDGGESWEGSFEGLLNEKGGFVSSLSISTDSPSIVYAGASSGLFVTIDSGKKWDRVPGKLLKGPVFSTFLPRKNPNSILTGTDSGLVRSSDNGKTWNVAFPDQPVLDFIQEEKTIILSTGKELFRSTDNGTTWENLSHGDMNLSINTFHFSDHDKQEILVGSSTGLFLMNKDKNLEFINLRKTTLDQDPELMKMSMLKMITEIHTGRFFGNYFYLIFDIATVFLIIVCLTGIYLTLFQAKIWKKLQRKIDDLDKLDFILEFEEKTKKITRDSVNIHDLAEHIQKHVRICKRISKNGSQRELSEIEGHMDSIDRKLHRFMDHLKVMKIK